MDKKKLIKIITTTSCCTAVIGVAVGGIVYSANYKLIGAPNTVKLTLKKR